MKGTSRVWHGETPKIEPTTRMFRQQKENPIIFIIVLIETLTDFPLFFPIESEWSYDIPHFDWLEMIQNDII